MFTKFFTLSGSIDIDKSAFELFLHEQAVISSLDTKPLAELRGLAFRICSALSTMISWDDIFNSLDAPSSTLDFKWLYISLNDVTRGELATDLTKEGIIGFMFIVHGADTFHEANIQKVMEDIKIRRLNFVKVNISFCCHLFAAASI